VAEYYYLIAQLPYLRYGQKPPMSSVSFLEMAGSFMNRTDAKLMKQLTLDPSIDLAKYIEKGSLSVKTGCEFIDNWLKWECAISLNLARYRSLKLYNESQISDPVVVPVEAYTSATQVFTQDGSPLDGELLLDKARWDIIDSMISTDYFNRNIVYAYYLKLLLMERRQIFNDIEIGFSEYKSLYAQIMERPRESNENSGINSTGEMK